MGAEHELHLVEYHEGQQEVVVQRAEDCHHHGRAYRQAFLGPAEDNGYLVFPIEPKKLAAEPGGSKGKAEDDETGCNQPR